MGTTARDPDALYRSRRWASARRRMRATIIWTILGLAVFVPLCAYAASPRGAAWTVLGAVVGVVLVLGFAVLFAWRAAGRNATSEIVRDWAVARGWGYSGRDMPAHPAPAGDDVIAGAQALADAEFPEATPLLRRGDRRYVTDVVAGVVDDVAVRIANHCYEVDSYGAEGERHTTYAYDLVALLERPLRITPMRLVRRSAVGRLFRGTGDTVRGWGAMRVLDLDNSAFGERYALEVDDRADAVDIFAVFDPAMQEQLADGRLIPDIDLIEAEGDWLMMAASGELDGDELDRLERMTEAVGWAVATLCSGSPGGR